MFDTIDYIKSTSDELKNLSLKIESTIFRTPRLNDTADRRACDKKCWAICPSFDLDQEAIDLLKSKTSNISTRVAPLKNYATVSTLLYTRTSARLDHVKAENSATYYLGLFEPLNASGTRAIGLAELALSHVQNKSLSSKLDDLKSLHRTIPEDISKRNFTTIDSDMSQYSNLSATVETMTNSILAKYNETMAVKNTENSLLLILETKDLDPISARSLQSIKNRSADLDIQFRDGLTISQLDELKENYTQLSDKCQGILTSESKSPASRIISLMRGFARNVNTGIAQVADKTQIMPRSDIPNNPLNLGFFSAVVFISLSSIALLVFLYIFAFNKFTIPKTNHILAAAFVVVITLIFVFTALMYAFLGKTSNDATLPEFLTDFNSKSSASILLDLRNATFADAAAMSSCASSLTSSFAQKNKTWAVYTLTPTSCTITNSFGVNSSLDTTECFKNVSKTDSSFVLSYSPTTEPQKFSIIYENKAEINANLNYYQSCPLVALFS
jgi:hypothetical protein